MRKLLVVIPYCQADVDLLMRLLGWIEEMGGCKENRVLLVADTKVPRDVQKRVADKATNSFKAVNTTTTPHSLADESWPVGPNWMFETTLRFLQNNPQGPFLWLEPDCVPMRKTWLDEIEKVYHRCGKAYLGQVVETDGKNGLPLKMLSGVAVYPAHAPRMLLKYTLGSKKTAWDVRMAQDILPYTHHTPLIWNLWGENKDLPPTFVRKAEQGQPRNATPLSRIPPATGLYHRCKDESLIELLRGTGGPSIPQIIMAFKSKTPIVSGGPVKIEFADEPEQVIHCVERHVQRTKEDEERVLMAYRSWERIYKAGEMKPCHVWEHDYPRHAGQLGDKRALPYLKDILVEGMTKATSPRDIIILTNDDTVLHPATVKAVKEKLRNIPCCGSFRVNFDKITDSHFEVEPKSLAERGLHDLGRDLFAFKKAWLKRWWHDLPDFILGELEWDLVVATMVRREAGVATTKLNRDQIQPVCEIDRGYVIHQTHERAWTSKDHQNSPAKQHNVKEAVAFYARNGFPSLIGNY